MMIFLNITDRLDFVMEIVNVYCAVGDRFLYIGYPNFVIIARLSSSCCFVLIKTHDLVAWLRTSKNNRTLNANVVFVFCLVGNQNAVSKVVLHMKR
jgi:hypothetical protein